MKKSPNFKSLIETSVAAFREQLLFLQESIGAEVKPTGGGVPEAAQRRVDEGCVGKRSRCSCLTGGRA
jgi:hypothetical protein